MSDTPKINLRPKRRLKWWLREIVAITAWILIFAALLAPQHLDVVPWDWVGQRVNAQSVLIVVLLILGISWLIGIRTMWHVAFVAGYPLVLPLRFFPRLLIRHWPILFIFLPGIRGFIKGLRLRSGLFSLSLAAVIACFSFTNPTLLKTSWIVLCIYLLWVFCHQVYMAYRPATAYSELVDILHAISGRLSPKELVNRIKNAKPSDAQMPVDEERSLAVNLLLVYATSSGMLYVAQHLQSLHRSFKLDLYLVWCIAKTYLLTVVIFAVIFSSIGFSGSSHFSIEPEGAIGFTGYLMFSFCNLMTSEISGINPVSATAKFFACIQLFFSFFLLVLIVFVVFTSLRDRHRSDLNIVISKFENAAHSISDLFESDFSLTKSAVEGILIGFATPISKRLIALQRGKDYAERLHEEYTKTSQAKPPAQEIEGTVIATTSVAPEAGSTPISEVAQAPVKKPIKRKVTKGASGKRGKNRAKHS